MKRKKSLTQADIDALIQQSVMQSKSIVRQCQRCHRDTSNINLCDECNTWYNLVVSEANERIIALSVASSSEIRPHLQQAWQVVYATPASDYDAKMSAVAWKDALEERERLLRNQEHQENEEKHRDDLKQDTYHERMKPKYTNRPGDTLRRLQDEDEE